MLSDRGNFQEIGADLESADPLEFSGPKTYAQKLKEAQSKTGLKEAALAGEIVIDERLSQELVHLLITPSCERPDVLSQSADDPLALHRQCHC